MGPKTIRVKAADPMRPVFRAGEPRKLDEGGNDTTVIRSEVVEVQNTRYYRRRIAAGDLVEVQTPPRAPKKEKEE